VTVKWYGDKLLQDIRSETPEGLFAGGEMLIAGATSRTPGGGTGTLAESGYVAIEGKSTYKPSKLHNKQHKIPPGGAVAGFAAFYARFVEYGTRYAGAKPFLRPAMDELQAQIGDTIVLTIARKFKR
jgi:HK97 gp10 family phage protein